MIGELAHGVGRYWCPKCKEHTVEEIVKPLYEAGTMNMPIQQEKKE
jgi:hypothetical protein